MEKSLTLPVCSPDASDPGFRTATAQDARALHPEEAVRSRYSAGAREAQPELCCPVHYDPRYLRVIPDEILERDYGCGDPTPYVRSGDTVIDLGSGAGKLCYIAAQLVGPTGKVVGIDCNAEMLALARRHRDTVAERLGHRNVEFRCGMIQDLRLDLDLLAAQLSRQPVRDQEGWLQLRQLEQRLRHEQPLVPDESADVVLSNCVLNLVRPSDRAELLSEVFRVLKPGGRAAISDIVSDEDVPLHLQQDPNLWSGCISGAFREDQFLAAFERAGFHGIQIAQRQAAPWRTVEGIEFRSITILAYKRARTAALDRNQALIYRGPFRKVEDDDGHMYIRGQRTAVPDATFTLLQREPYERLFEPIAPLNEMPLNQARPFDANRPPERTARETKGIDYHRTSAEAASCCGPTESCC